MNFGDVEHNIKRKSFGGSMKNGDQAAYYFHQGTNTHAYEYLGVSESSDGESFCYVFRTFAPNAKAVFVVGDFTGWDSPFSMERITERGIYEAVFRADHSLVGSAYKFQIEGKDGVRRYKGDPYARSSRSGLDGASVIVGKTDFVFEDEGWLGYRRKSVAQKDGAFLSVPINIYEVHAGSFLRHKDNSYYTYRELAEALIPYVKEMGYTHVEFLPLSEFPYDGSWGYQVGAFYAPTGRFGSPDDFRYMVNKFHKAGVGVLLDWVPAHFPKDEWGLFEFDGTPLYEYQGKDRMESSSWGTRFFDLGREEVQSFLISNALYYLREFHIDGLRVDAVASMLYLDYDRKPGEWFPNPDGSRENREAIAFLKKLNQSVLSEFPDVLMIAEESTAFPGVTRPVSAGGLGFTLKWNMGFANDMYSYLESDHVYRQYHHDALTFPILYAFGENYVLPVSHDEVVHGKKSLIDKMFGSYEDKFRQARTFLLMLMTYPGKKMLFMGSEFAQFREWDYENALEWFMLDYPKHKEFREYVRALNHFYLSREELWKWDFSGKGFSWILADEKQKNVAVYRRFKNGENTLFTVISFSPVVQTVTFSYTEKSDPAIVFATDSTVSNKDIVIGRNDKSITLSVPPYFGAVFADTPRKLKISSKNKG